MNILDRDDNLLRSNLGGGTAARDSDKIKLNSIVVFIINIMKFFMDQK